MTPKAIVLDLGVPLREWTGIDQHPRRLHDPEQPGGEKQNRENQSDFHDHHLQKTRTESTCRRVKEMKIVVIGRWTLRHFLIESASSDAQ